MEYEAVAEHIRREKERADLAEVICAVTWALVKWDDLPAASLGHLDRAYGILTDLLQERGPE